MGGNNPLFQRVGEKVAIRMEAVGRPAGELCHGDKIGSAVKDTVAGYCGVSRDSWSQEAKSGWPRRSNCARMYGRIRGAVIVGAFLQMEDAIE